MKELEYPFDESLITKKKKQFKRKLLEHADGMLEKKIAVLGGSTTHDIVNCLELFLLNQGIRPQFFQTEYNRYWETIMFDDPDLMAFAPDVIFIHTTTRNIKQLPSVKDSQACIEEKLSAEYQHFSALWDKAYETYHCPIIQNNFEPPFYRLLGNSDCSDIHGASNFIYRLNGKFYDYAQTHAYFHIHDINFLASDFGLQRWSDPFAWYMYKYALSMQAIPQFSYSLSNIIKALFGKNKKALVLDLDNTLWGGVIGDDGADGIVLGQETAMGQIYQEFQSYLKAHQDLGVLLCVDSKNEPENALAGLQHQDSLISPEDIICMKANWNPKSQNIEEIANELSLGADSFVFVDDNPAERELVREQIPGIAAPEMGRAEQYIQILSRCGFFETTSLSPEDMERSQMYRQNAKRQAEQLHFQNYEEYLHSLEMKADILPFDSASISRIAQLSNKTNQFNLTTRRYTQEEIEEISKAPEYVALYGRLFDKFGDNGIVSVIIGKREQTALNIDLWIMSCRVLKRDMELAMMDALAKQCVAFGINTIYGYYAPTAKNNMVRNHYERLGFTKIQEGTDGATKWELSVSSNYSNKNGVIKISSY